MLLNLEVYDSIMDEFEESFLPPFSTISTNWKIGLHPGVRLDISVFKDGELESLSTNNLLYTSKYVLSISTKTSKINQSCHLNTEKVLYKRS